MKQILEDLKSIPGVIGSYVFSSKHGITASIMPKFFKEEKLEKVGRSLLKIYSTGMQNFSDTSEISLFYEESVVIIREAIDNCYLIVFYEPSLNLNLLTMSMNLAMDELKEIISNQPNVNE